MRWSTLAICVAMLSVLLITPVATSAASRPPRCHGKVATEWLTSPGTITNFVENAVVVGSSGDDFIRVTGANAIVCAGNGNDDVHLEGVNQVAYLGNGNDAATVYNNSVVYGESGHEYYLLLVDSAKGYGGSGNDEFASYDSSVSDGGSGDDRIFTLGPVTVNGGSGKDSISVGDSDGATIDCGPNADKFANSSGSPASVKRCENLPV